MTGWSGPNMAPEAMRKRRVANLAGGAGHGDSRIGAFMDLVEKNHYEPRERTLQTSGPFRSGTPVSLLPLVRFRQPIPDQNRFVNSGVQFEVPSRLIAPKTAGSGGIRP